MLPSSIIKSCIRSIGKNCRYLYFKIIDKPKSINELSEQQDDVDKNYSQYYANLLVGSTVIMIPVIIISFIGC